MYTERLNSVAKEKRSVSVGGSSRINLGRRAFGYASSDYHTNTMLRSVLRFTHSDEMACCGFVFAATMYHIWPGSIIGVAVLLVNIVLMMRFPALLIWIATYGYLVHTVLVPDDTRIVFSIPIVMSLLIGRKHSVDRSSRLIIKPIVIVLCCALGMAILLSETADPTIGKTEGRFVLRLINIGIALLVARSIKSEHDRRLSLYALSVSSICVTLFLSWHMVISGAGSLYRLLYERKIGDSDPNYLALYLCIGLGPLFAISACNATKKWISSVLHLMFGLVVSWGVVLTSSRMGSLLIGANLGVAIMRFHKSKFVSVLILLGLAVAFIFFVFPLLENVPQFSALNERWTSADALTGGGRAGIFTSALEAFGRVSPVQALFGGGTEANYVMLKGTNTHNSYLEFLLDHGLLGMGLLVVILFVALMNIWHTLSLPHSSSMWAIWLSLVVASFALSPFVYSWAWVALAPLLVSPANPTQIDTGMRSKDRFPVRR